MPIFSFVQTKGGTGKTTLSQCVAFSKQFEKKFENIALIELDRQGSLADWFEIREQEENKNQRVSFYPLVDIKADELARELEKIINKHQAIILDVPGESVGGFASRLALNLSDIVLIPMRTSTNDESSFARNLWHIIEESLDDTEDNTTFMVVPTFLHPQANSTKIREYFVDIMPKQIGCLTTALHNRAVFENFSREGMTLLDFAKSVSANRRLSEQVKKAVGDIEGISKEIIGLIK